MKKYNYLNKSQKLLLAMMTIPLSVTVLPIAENVSANQIPMLQVYDLNGSPKLEWATEILQENILITDGFNNETNFNLNNSLSGLYPNTLIHEFDTANKVEGKSSLKIAGTTNGRGNYYNSDFDNKSDTGGMMGSIPLYLPDNSNLSISFKIKNTSDVDFGLSLWNHTTDYGVPTNSFIKETANVGDKKIKVTDTTGLYVGFYMLTNKTFPIGNYSFAYITNINYETNEISLSSPILEKMNPGDTIKQHTNPSAASFSRNIISQNNDWQLINLNAPFGNEYFTSSRGTYLNLVYKAENTFNIDDFVIGYATEVEVYREGQSIYRGFLSDFYDTTIKDTVKPNKVETINSSITNDFNVKLNILKPQDNGIKTNYQIQSIAKNGNRSALSTPQEVELKSNVMKYKYSISNKSNDTPIIETNSLEDISFPLKSINLETDYIHVQAVDGNGNVSDVSSFKLNELVDMQDLYNKVKELENSNNYKDFIDFIDEIESLYGDNLPQDIKEMIDKLGKHHGVNTSFLLLEEGDFRLTTTGINSFGKIELTPSKKTVTTSFKDCFNIIDARGTQQGWHVSVSATPFAVETFDGFVGTPHQLPVGSLALNEIVSVEQVGSVHNSQLPKVNLKGLTAIDGQNQTVNILNADKNKGMGEFKFTFEEKAIALTVDAVIAKIDEVNYPNSNTPYASTVTWDLVSGPQI